MLWQMSHRAERRSCEIADRHYNRQKIGSPQFVPPGRCLVLYAETPSGRAFWVTSWPFAEYAFHAWAGAWVCSAFRNEGAGRASDLIRQAVAATRAYWGEPPELGLVTFIDRRKVTPIKVRGQPTWGRRSPGTLGQGGAGWVFDQPGGTDSRRRRIQCPSIAFLLFNLPLDPLEQTLPTVIRD